MRHVHALPLLLLGILSPMRVLSQPGSEAGAILETRVKSYFAAFNSGDTVTIRNFLEKNFSPDALIQVPVAQRLERYRGMREHLGTLTLQRLQLTGHSTATAEAESEHQGALTFIFESEMSPPHLLTGIRVEKRDGALEPPVARAADDQALVAATGTMIDSLLREDRFSGVVLVAKNDSVIFERAGGYADRENQIPNTIETRFNVGSINKSFTRVAISQLASAGRLALPDTIGKYLPDYPNRQAASSVTINHLLEMESGIPDFFGERFEKADRSTIRSLKDYVPLFADKPLEFAPGTSRRYSNGGYIVLGLIIERVAGTDYYTYIHDHVFVPAGMESTEWIEKSATRQDMARGYISGEHTPNVGTLPQRGSSAGGGYSTAHDLLRYTHALRMGTLRLPDSEGGLGIAGGAPGLNAALEMDPGSGYVIVVLANLDPPAAESVARTIRRMVPGN